MWSAPPLLARTHLKYAHPITTRTKFPHKKDWRPGSQLNPDAAPTPQTLASYCHPLITRFGHLGGNWRDRHRNNVCNYFQGST